MRPIVRFTMAAMAGAALPGTAAAQTPPAAHQPQHSPEYLRNTALIEQLRSRIYVRAAQSARLDDTLRRLIAARTHEPVEPPPSPPPPAYAELLTEAQQQAEIASLRDRLIWIDAEIVRLRARIRAERQSGGR